MNKKTLLFGIAAIFILFAILGSSSPKTQVAQPEQPAAQSQATTVTPSPTLTLTASPTSIPTIPPAIRPATESGIVVRVLDGDTVELDNGEKVRYIGVDTPEIKHGARAAQCYADTASQLNATLVAGKRIFLERDRSNRDRYGRLLRFVYLEDGRMVNAVLVQEGAARADAFRPDISKKALFEQLEQQAKTQQKGRWKDCIN